MTRALWLIIPGALFGFGLALSGMTDPAKVVGFLDLGGTWDPRLAFVMGGAVVSFAVLYRILLSRTRQRQGRAFVWGTVPRPTRPQRLDLDGRLLGGAALFGVGWGLAGLCPGPALANLAWLRPDGLTFVACMIAGMLITQRFWGSDST